MGGSAVPLARLTAVPPVTCQDVCKATLCETDVGRFVVNTTACSDKAISTINASAPFTVRFATEPDAAHDRAIICRVDVLSRRRHYISLTANRLPGGFTGKFLLVLEAEDDRRQSSLHREKFTHEMIRKSNVSFLSLNTVHVFFLSYKPFPTRAVTIHVDFKEGTYVHDLPVVMLSNTVGYVTSPGFDNNENYPNDYEGEFRLNVAGNESVLVNFISFRFDRDKKDYLIINVLNQKRVWTFDRWKSDIQVHLFRSPLLISFHTDSTIRESGCKVMFARVPRFEEPEQLPSKLFNCSVPNFRSFKPVFHCNRLVECDGGEDEHDCGHHQNDTGSKGYHVVLRHRRLTWFDAHRLCIQRGQKLATLENPDEFRRFRSLAHPVAHLLGFFVGAQLMERLEAVSISTMYRNIWKWVDGRSVFSAQIHNDYQTGGSCALFDPWVAKLNSISCHRRLDVAAFACEDHERDKTNSTADDVGGSGVTVKPVRAPWNVSVAQCPSGHVTRDFLSCDFRADCGASFSGTSCSVGGVTAPMFACRQSRASVHYTSVCDHMQHCSDNSDEDFCRYPDCSSTSVRCRNGQCVRGHKWCDRKLDCHDGSDERCPPSRYSIPTASPPGTIFLDGEGNYRLERTDGSAECPPTHFLCPRSFCLPVYLRCNGVVDCMGREDEAGCDEFQCRGFYRCRDSKACLHHGHVCDGIPQCPEQDDELLCDFACPDECRCQGLAFVCASSFAASSPSPVRYLDSTGSNTTLSDVRDSTRLIALRLAKCHIGSLPPGISFPNLRELDLSWNKLRRLRMHYFHSLENLRVLILLGNPLRHIAKSSGSVKLMLESVDLSYTDIEVFNASEFTGIPSIKTLNLSWSKLVSIEEGGFGATPRLQSLDFTGCRLTSFPKNLLRDLAYLKTVRAENYKLCCEATLPVHFELKNCHAARNLLASCDDLLKSNAYRIFLWVFASLSVAGNTFSVGVRLYPQRGKTGAQGSFGVFVTHLSVADFLMGVYLGVIGTADIVYRGRYLWRDEEWKRSPACSVAGFLCLLSSETSALIICLITLDRFLVLRFPFGRTRFRHRSATAASGAVWTLGLFLAVVPLLPVTSHWGFYSQTGICIPLPFTGSEVFRGYGYSFGVSILFNLTLFLLIAVGQAVIYWAVRANSIASSADTQARDAAIARRLVTVVVSDFLCWFPIGLLGLLAATGTQIPGDLNVAVATFVLPVNSALNPFLYTFNLLMEKRRKAQNEKLLKRLEQVKRS